MTIWAASNKASVRFSYIYENQSVECRLPGKALHPR